MAEAGSIKEELELKAPWWTKTIVHIASWLKPLAFKNVVEEHLGLNSVGTEYNKYII